MENWKPVPRFEGLYEVSDLGRIRRPARMKSYVVNGGKAEKFYPLFVLSPTPTTTDRLQVILYKDGKCSGVRVHQAVCEAFHGPKPSERHMVAHYDGNHRNNRADNLRWATGTENNLDRRRHGTARSYHKLSHDAVIEIISRLNKGHIQRDIATDHGVAQTTVNRIALRQTWKEHSHLLNR